jgi:glycosyltransferase involved in cell wall biosynthesis
MSNKTMKQTDIIKLAIVSGSTKKLDSFRGIGANTNELEKELLRNKQIKIVDNFAEADIVHFASFRPYFISLPFFKPKNQKWILTIHDLIMLIYPKHYPSGVKGKIRFLINKILIKLYVDKIITISETSKKDIVRFLGVDPKKVEVVYIAAKSAIKKLDNGAWQSETKKKFNLPDKFVLFDHGVNYNKNLPTLIKACKKVGISLAVVGKEIENLEKFNLGNSNLLKGPFDIIRNILGITHPQLLHVEEISKALKNGDFIGLGYVSDEDLNKLFNFATLYVQPSFYEGFGMPIIEAMTVGTPVISSRTQALVEIGGDACLYFDPKNVDELVEKIKLMLGSSKMREEYIKKGYEQAKKYSWKKSSYETIKIYNSTLK